MNSPWIQGFVMAVSTFYLDLFVASQEHMEHEQHVVYLTRIRKFYFPLEDAGALSREYGGKATKGVPLYSHSR